MLLRALSKVVGGHSDTWDEYLDAVMFGLRTKKQITAQQSPYFLMFGREAQYPCKVPEHYEAELWSVFPFHGIVFTSRIPIFHLHRHCVFKNVLFSCLFMNNFSLL